MYKCESVSSLSTIVNCHPYFFAPGLPTIIPKLPHRVALHRVVPCLAKEFVNPHMVPFVLPGVLQIAEEATQQDFTTYILPELKSVMKITDPVQVRRQQQQQQQQQQ